MSTEKAVDKRLPEPQETAHTSALQRYHLFNLNRRIHYVKLGVRLNLGATYSFQLCCWLVAQIPSRPFFLQHERRLLSSYSGSCQLKSGSCLYMTAPPRVCPTTTPSPERLVRAGTAQRVLPQHGRFQFRLGTVERALVLHHTLDQHLARCETIPLSLHATQRRLSVD